MQACTILVPCLRRSLARGKRRAHGEESETLREACKGSQHEEAPPRPLAAKVPPRFGPRLRRILVHRPDGLDSPVGHFERSR